MNSEDIKQAVHDALNERDGLDRDTHRSHHNYIAQRIQKEQEREQRRVALNDKIKATVIGGIVLMAVTVVGTGLYNVGRFVIDLYQKSQSGH